MMKRTALLHAFVLALGLSAVLSGRSLAQTTEGSDGTGCGLCADYLDVTSSTGDYVHAFGVGFGGAVFACGNICHRYMVPGVCYDNHGGCFTAVRANVEKVRLALRDLDLSGLRTAMAALGDKASINRTARTIEVYGCGQIREVVASFRASEPILAALAAGPPPAPPARSAVALEPAAVQR
jgi:hypothetical protein